MPRLALVAAISVVALLGVACRSVQLAGCQEVPRGFVGVYECEGFNSIGTPYRLTLSIGAVVATWSMVAGCDGDPSRRGDRDRVYPHGPPDRGKR